MMKGLYVASITPYDRENKINEEAAKQLFSKNLEEGAKGFFVGGSSAECFLMTREERVQLFEIASGFKEKADLFAHVGALSTDEAIYYAKEAKAMGYENIAATPPFYFGYSQKTIAQYFYDIAEAVDMPILYYNIPCNTYKELDLTNADTIALLKSGALSGVKHTNLDVYQMERIKNVNPELLTFGGFEQNMVAFLALGCDGFIGSTFNFMLPHYKKIYDLYLDGKSEDARKLQIKANNIMECIWNIGLFPAIKHILNARGMYVGEVRKPFLELSQEEKEIVDRVVRENLEN